MPGAGQLNTRIDILKGIDTDDANTGEQTTQYKALYRDIPAKKEDISGGSTRRGLQVEETVRSVFTIPFIEGISPHWRVKVRTAGGDGPEMEIVSALDRDDLRFWMELHCADVKS